MDDDRTQITLWLGDSQLDEWDEYANDLGFSSRSEMIRRSVEFFHGHKTKGGREQQGVRDAIEDLHDNIERIQSEVYAIRSEQLSKEDTDDLAEDLAYQVEQQITQVSPDVDEYVPPEEALREALEDVLGDALEN